MAGDRVIDALRARGVGAERVVEGERAGDDAARDSPRAFASASAWASCVAAIASLTDSTAHRHATIGRA